jgi:putative ABC transport system substrate-binding protein
LNEAPRVHIAARRRGSGVARSWRAQQPERVRRIGVLMPLAADDTEGQVRNAAFLQGLQELGWTVGRNLRLDYRWAAGDADRLRSYAAELVALAPDVILASGTSTVAPLLRATRTVPIVFAGGRRSCRHRLRRQPGAAGRQRHRFHDV